MTIAQPKGRREKTAVFGYDIEPAWIDAVCKRLARNQRVRRTLPAAGRLHIDRQLPFLCVYRQPEDFEDTGTERLIKGEASYLIASGAPDFHDSLSKLVRQVVGTLTGGFGAFLLIELWADLDGGEGNDPEHPAVSPMFTIHAPAARTITRTVEALERQLRRLRVLKQSVDVTVVRNHGGRPPKMALLMTPSEANELNCSCIGLAVPPVYRKAHSTAEFPLLARTLRRNLSLALRRSYFEFVRSNTTHRPLHYHALGRRAVVKAVWEIDRQLAEVSEQFDYLLHLTPVNANSAWEQFQRDRLEQTPEFHYRPLPVDPALLKRKLYKIPIERVEDPALQRLFQQKQEELEAKLTMLRDRDTPRFLHHSIALFGGVEDALVLRAQELLRRLSKGSERDEGRSINAAAFLERVEGELERYHEAFPGFKGQAQVTDGINGLLVSRGRLLINSDLRLAPWRVKALLAHEVGTHLVTYYNGRAQPFQQLYSGLAGYEQLQEGLAVLSEYLVGGLTRSRMRQLAARVIAVRQLRDGASFVETFRMLHRKFGFAGRAAYNVTMRVYRGGGLTKDGVYLRGLEEILRYLNKGGDLNPLFVGKIALEHIPIIKELQYRKVLRPVPMLPRYLKAPGAKGRLERVRGCNISVTDLVNDTNEDGTHG